MLYRKQLFDFKMDPVLTLVRKKSGRNCLIILEVIVKEVEPEHAYTEIEVNRILLEFHEDVATLRRGLIGMVQN